MMLKALIIEQLEADGVLRTFTMQPSQHSESMIVAFADEYDEDRFGPFHFLDENDARRFADGFAKCRARRVGERSLHKTGSAFHFKTEWSGIPTERHWLSYYALSLPEYAILEQLSISDPHRLGHEYRRTVTRDDQRNRYVIYLECASSIGRFDFQLTCDFTIDTRKFTSSEYQDLRSEGYGHTGDDWKYSLPEEEREKVQQFFAKSIHLGDTYLAGQAGAMGPNARAHDIDVQQTMMTSILFLAADPTDASRLRLSEELREIQEKLQLAKLRDRFELHQRMSVRPADISQALLDVQPQVVHFSGHGTATGALCFENQIGEIHPIQPDALAALFGQFADQISCVVLNACYSEIQANAIAGHIDYVIGMNQAIGDKAAIAFAIGFYQALGAGRTVEEAYRLGCVQIRLQNIPEHLTPALKSKAHSVESVSKEAAVSLLGEYSQEAVKHRFDEEAPSNVRQIGQWVLVLSATVDEINRPMAEAIVAHLQKLSGDTTLTLQRIESGSVRVFLEGSRSGFERTETLVTTGQLTSVLGIEIKEILWRPKVETREGKVSQPTLAIGLGGTGDKVIRHLKQQVWNSISSNGTVGLLVVDTEELYNRIGEERLDQSEHLYIGGYDATRILKNLPWYPEIRDWWPVQEHIGEARSGIAYVDVVRHGAGQRRPIGRLSFFHRYHEFSSHLASKVRAIKAATAKEQVQYEEGNAIGNGLLRIYIVASLCGGTGAGIFLDVAFKVREELRDEAHITGIFVLPLAFLPVLPSGVLQERAKANAYASLLELDHYMSAGEPIEIKFPDGAVQSVRRPFDRIYLVGDFGAKREPYGRMDNVFRTIAEAIRSDIITPHRELFEPGHSLLRLRGHGYHVTGVDLVDDNEGGYGLDRLEQLPGIDEYKRSYRNLRESGEVLHPDKEWK